jgi:hypothetical protein
MRIPSWIMPAIGVLLLGAAAAYFSGPRRWNRPGPNGDFTTSADSQFDFAAMPDESLSTEEYVRLGMPPPNRVWNSDDLLQAEKILTSLPDERQLPRHGSPRSGKCFARITSFDNFRTLRPPTSPADDETLMKVALQAKASSSIHNLYRSAAARGLVGDAELVDICALELRITAMLNEMATARMKSIDRKDPTYQDRKNGIERMRHGSAMVAGEALAAFEPRRRFRDSELARLLDAMNETFPILVSFCTPESQTETMQRLDAVLVDHRSGELHAGLIRLHEAAKAAIEKLPKE